MKSLKLMIECTLLDDPSVLEESTIIGKWNTIIDGKCDLTLDDWLNALEIFMRLGLTHPITITVEEEL